MKCKAKTNTKLRNLRPRLGELQPITSHFPFSIFNLIKII